MFIHIPNCTYTLVYTCTQSLLFICIHVLVNTLPQFCQNTKTSNKLRPFPPLHYHHRNLKSETTIPKLKSQNWNPNPQTLKSITSHRGSWVKSQNTPLISKSKFQIQIPNLKIEIPESKSQNRNPNPLTDVTFALPFETLLFRDDIIFSVHEKSHSSLRRKLRSLSSPTAFYFFFTGLCKTKNSILHLFHVHYLKPKKFKI